MINAAAIKQIHRWHGDSDGYVSLFRKFPNGATRQYSYKASELSAHVAEWCPEGAEDVYMSVNTFFRPQRTTDNLRQLKRIFVDIDCHTVGYTPEQTVMRLKSDYFSKEIPVPNEIVYSGRGICIVYHIDPVPYKLAFKRWKWVESSFVSKLKELGADENCQDACRVLRLAGTNNSKNGKTVEIEVLHGDSYDLEEIMHEYTITHEFKPKQKQEKRKYTKSSCKHKKFTLQRARCSDIKTLVQLRHGQCTGMREYLLYNYRYNMSFFAPGQALQKTLELNSMFSEPLPHREVISATKNVYTAYQQSMVDKKPVYRLKNETFISRVAMTDGEMKHMKTFISKEEAEHRKQQRRQGKRSWSAYLAYLQERKQNAAKKLYQFFCSNPKATNKEAAVFMGKSISTIKRLKILFSEFIAEGLVREREAGSHHNTRNSFEPPTLSQIVGTVANWMKPLLE